MQVEGPVRLRAVVLGGHRADEAGRAVAALGTAGPGHLLLHGVQVGGGSQPFGGDDLLAVEGGGGDQAGVDRHPARALAGEGAGAAVGPGDHDGAGTALTFGAALLAAGESVVAQGVQGTGVHGAAGGACAGDVCPESHSVDGQLCGGCRG